MINKLLVIGLAVALSACASGPQITTVQELQESADAPYENILVVALFESFDMRRYLEKEVVGQLSELGVKAVASTSMMNTKTPVTRKTFVDMVEKLNSDAVLVTQLVSLNTGSKMQDMNPQSTYNIRPTYYYNVWSVELTEYVEPQSMELSHTLVLATQLYSVLNREPVWAIESKSKIVQDYDHRQDYSVFVDEAEAISSHMSRDGLLAP
ncbi:MAG: hypothetical protein OEU90_06235 [Gammaproteobacteria bacterium]|nr:hypothetical protein [Gammaproteobacteria bacterium]MDH3751105.1 hypothetical protein [Gammaproteobacteria bacterium]MDH3805057.1 hypothetical protein [Gammaproteobacteria bacterium]